MKKILTILGLSALISGAVAGNAHASSEEITGEQRQGLFELGFDQQIIDQLDSDQVELFLEEGGSVVDSDTKKVDVEVDEATGEEIYKEIDDNMITPFDLSDGTSENWMELFTVATRLGNGDIRITHNFNFQGNSPRVHFTDAIGVTHSGTSQNIVNDSTFNYTVGSGPDDNRITRSGTHNNSAPYANDYGVAYEFDLLTNNGVNAVHYGNMTTVLTDNGSGTSSTAYGHFTHTNVGGIITSIGIQVGAISINGVANTTEMPQTQVSWDW